MSWLSKLLRWPGSGPDDPPIEPERLRDPDEAVAGASAALESAIAEHRARRWVSAEPLFRWVIDNPVATARDRQVARNILGNLLERNRRTDEAVTVYEANLAEGFTGSYPYERLAAIYRKQRRPDDEVRVLRRAVAIVEQELRAGRSEVAPQLDRLRAKLAEAARSPQSIDPRERRG